MSDDKQETNLAKCNFGLFLSRRAGDCESTDGIRRYRLVLLLSRGMMDPLLWGRHRATGR